MTTRANIDAAAATPGLHDAVVIGFARREQGLLVAPGNPRKLTDIASVAAAKARIAQRSDGAGAQLLLLSLLDRAGLKRDRLNALSPPCVDRRRCRAGRAHRPRRLRHRHPLGRARRRAWISSRWPGSISTS